jgi:hypothetical protein
MSPKDKLLLAFRISHLHNNMVGQISTWLDRRQHLGKPLAAYLVPANHWVFLTLTLLTWRIG